MYFSHNSENGEMHPISELSERRYFLIGDLKLNKPKIYNYFRSTVPSM